ncbi:antirestriction protein ArdA [Roseobacter litoralis]|uniref:antirestriction protein ArdA n=1 Tax=Roseobacter litoralis TaxID=42443 RepID=UPI00248F8CE9|nr:antirestriction protein ArdA [Roseobacter litoralis]
MSKKAETQDRTILYAQPYQIGADGFYFEDAEAYAAKAEAARNHWGEPVEEFEIQFIDGEAIDAALFEAVGVHQGDIAAFFDAAQDWDDHQKRVVIIAAGECGYTFNLAIDTPDDLEVDIYDMDSLTALAAHFVDEGLFGDIPERLQFYIDYEAIGRDLGMDYTLTNIAGDTLIYRAH